MTLSHSFDTINYEGMELFGGCCGGGKSWGMLPRAYLMVFKVNGASVLVSVRNKCTMQDVMKFVSKEKKVPVRLIKFESGGHSIVQYSDLYFNN